VLSTLHTNDAASSVTRLVDIGIEGYKIAAALKGIVAQRLLRKLCTQCRELWAQPIPQRLQRWIPPATPLYRAVGCPECSMTGYRGRMAIVEVLSTNPEIERRIVAGESAERVAEAARDGGMKSLFESGLAHVLKGETTLEELLRVVEIPAEDPGRKAAQRPTPQRGNGKLQAVRAIPDLQEPNAPPRVTPLSNAAVSPFREAGAFELLDELEPPEQKIGDGHKVLLVEDEEPLRRVLRELLERDGYTVVEAADGVQALDQVDRTAPDVVVLDLNLPRLDGFGVLNHLRARPATAGLPVIVLTAKGDEDSEVRVFESGAQDFIAKPFRPRALSARVQSVLARR
jgi:CheY-like chemotaxis protein